MLVSIQNISKTFLDDLVLKDISLDINEGDRIGLLGVNGAGKTTLLNIITGNIEPDEGTVSRKRGLSIGYLQQNDAFETSRTIEEEAKDAFREVLDVKEEMDNAALKLANEPENEKLLLEYDRLCAKFEAIDGWHIDEKINRVLTGLKFSQFSKDTLISTLSGGEKTRFGIAKMLLAQPDLLILDEPTNHLDFSMLSWLEEYLETYTGAVLVVSHDRYFLDAVAKNVCELEFHSLAAYKGGYSSFKTQKAERFKVAMRAWEKQQEEIAHMEEFVRKNLARSSSAQGVGTRVKALEKMERLEKPRTANKTIKLRFSYDVEPFSTILNCENLGASVIGGRQLFNGIGLEVRRGEKVAIVGLNGVGKSTFLKSLLKNTEYEKNIDSTGLEKHGKVQWGGNVHIGYFDQELAGLDLESTVLEAVHSRYPLKTEHEIRSALGRMLIEGEAVYKKVKELSGANRAKVAFAILAMKRSNVLVLDEPTNHLDYLAKDALEEALNSYTGTVIAVSHDRYFLRRVPDRILEMTPEHFEIYNGNYDFYLEKKNAIKIAEQDATAKIANNAKKAENSTRTQSGYRSKEQRSQEAQRRNRLSAVEKEIHSLECKIDKCENALQAEENQSKFEALEEFSKALTECNKKLECLMEEWLELNSSEN